ncbi:MULTISPECIES: hypothetical protein [Streptomyces]|uniref:DUF8094 domain-containing protein n=1 Tax=Streptomyces chilikensis TaxID=1194079 RepID=A0ABV3EXS8_9ACTN|nr:MULTISPECIES: hypothetical protein [Streptomyces]MDH6227216.1 hypothetical protein [Streptomyces sp. MJP52]
MKSTLGRRVLPAAAAALSLVLSGCVVVHGEREVLPAATPQEARGALRAFTDAYNAADKAYDPGLDENRVTGAFGDIDGARLKARHAGHPEGNARHEPLRLTDSRYVIPAKAGWPRWFLVDSAANKGGDARWMLVFVKERKEEPWQVAYLTLLDPDDVPEFRKDEDGHAEPAAGGDPLALPPSRLSKAYADYLGQGGDAFAEGPHTSAVREQRKKNEKRPGLVRQFQDEPLTRGDYAPLGLRTADGGALVFFATRHFEKLTAAPGTAIPVQNADVRALTTGEVEQTLTMEYVSQQAVRVPRTGQAVFLGRVPGLIAARGE